MQVRIILKVNKIIIKPENRRLKSLPSPYYPPDHKPSIAVKALHEHKASIAVDALSLASITVEALSLASITVKALSLASITVEALSLASMLFRFNALLLQGAAASRRCRFKALPPQGPFLQFVPGVVCTVQSFVVFRLPRRVKVTMTDCKQVSNQGRYSSW
jgi:hypothetical protein